jgi:hypothetical protein
MSALQEPIWGTRMRAMAPVMRWPAMRDCGRTSVVVISMTPTSAPGSTASPSIARRRRGVKHQALEIFFQRVDNGVDWGVVTPNIVNPIAGLPPLRRRPALALDVGSAGPRHADDGGGAVGENLTRHGIRGRQRR